MTPESVTFRWVANLSLAEVANAAALRQVPGVEAQIVGDRLWLRGTHVAADERDLLRLMPGVRPYLMAADGQLTRVGERVPSARLPDGAWQRLNEVVHVLLPEPQATFAGRPAPVPLTLVRSSAERPPTLLLTSLDTWSRFADTAPQWRLEVLAFAADRAGRVLLRGTPLPAIPGEFWVERDGIAVPAGWTWQPELSPDVLRKALNLDDRDIALLSADRFAVVQGDDWVQATRSAVRETRARFAAGNGRAEGRGKLHQRATPHRGLDRNLAQEP